LCVFNVFVNHGGCWGSTAQAFARWWHLVALHEATDVLHWAMRPALYRRIHMVIEITSTFPEFFVVVDSVETNNLR
jgi:hypothetical protein